MLGDTGNKRAVRILLECVLVRELVHLSGRLLWLDDVSTRHSSCIDFLETFICPFYSAR